MFACGEGRYLGIVDSMGHASKTLQLENWNQLKIFTPEIQAMPKLFKLEKKISCFCSDEPVRSVCLYLCLNVHNLIPFFSVYCFS